MQRWHAKIGACIGTFIIPLICTLLPVKVTAIFEKKGETGKTILSCLMCFGGGVFFATYMLHMGPEVRDIIHVALVKPYNLVYPIADFLMAAGFFMVMFMEKAVIACSQRRKTKQEEKRKDACLKFNQPYMSVNGGGDNPSMPLPASVTGTPSHPPVDTCPLRGTGDCCSDPVELKMQSCEEEDVKIVNGDAEHGLMHAHPEADILRDATSTRSLVLLMALSLHRIFEGMSVGLQHSTHNVWNLFIAVMCHETVIGFSLGLEFVKNNWKTSRICLACFLCSLIMPLGAMIGTLVSEIGQTSTATFDLVNGVLQAIATGTFIYVTFFEILQDEISAHDAGLSKLISVLVGFLVMAALCLIPEEDDMLKLPQIVAENVTTTDGY